MLYPTLAKNIIYSTLAEVEQIAALGEEDLDDVDEYGFTPLIEAVIFNKLDIVQWLLAKGVNVNFASLTGHTALHWAVENHNLEVCELLLEHGADPNAFSRGAQPILVLPVLRNQTQLKQLLYKYGGDLSFAQDYIATKLLAHRYELISHVDLVNSKNVFIELDLEGFFLEFTIGIIQSSLERYKSHFAARRFRSYFYFIHHVIEAFKRASELIRYQHFSIDYKQFDSRINQLLNHSLQMIPLGYEGHAVCFIRYHDILVKCDRGVEGRKYGSVVIYRMKNSFLFNKDYIKQLMYTKQNRKSIIEDLPKYLGLTAVTQLPIPAQVTGNCSWANIEAAIPTMLFLLFIEQHRDLTTNLILECKEKALMLFREWRDWDKHTALSDFIKSAKETKGPRQASKAMVLAALLFQKLNYSRFEDVKTAEKILPILMQPHLRYILESYKKVFSDIYKTSAGNNLRHLMEISGYSFREHQ